MDIKLINIRGSVIRGDGYGRKLGFPTVNLDIGDQKIPEEGVYAGEASLEGKAYSAAIVIGPKHKVEAHLLRYNGDAYGRLVTLTMHKFLREFKKFSTEEELIIQIKKDLERI